MTIVYTIQPSIVPARQDQISPGEYIARHRNWLSRESWVTVLVAPARPTSRAKAASNALYVYEQGKSQPSSIAHWIFRNRIVGIKEITDEWHQNAIADLFPEIPAECRAAFGRGAPVERLHFSNA